MVVEEELGPVQVHASILILHLVADFGQKVGGKCGEVRDNE